MRPVTLALFALALASLPLAVRAEESALEAIGEAEIVTPHLNRRHVIGTPEEAKPAGVVADGPQDARPPTPALVPDKPVKSKKAEKAERAAKAAKDAKDAKDAKAAAKAAAKKGKAAVAVAAAVEAPVDPGYSPSSDAVLPALEDEPEIVAPTRARNIVLTPAPRKESVETFEATMPKAAARATDEELPSHARVEAADEAPSQPMRGLRMGLGFAVVGAMAGNLATTQLDHADHFLGSNTARYSFVHHATEYGTLGAFAATALVEAMGPDSRSTLHKVAFVTATLAVLAQGGLLVATDQREGYDNQMTLSRAHLGASYTAAAALALSSFALAF